MVNKSHILGSNQRDQRQRNGGGMGSRQQVPLVYVNQILRLTVSGTETLNLNRSL